MFMPVAYIIFSALFMVDVRVQDIQFIANDLKKPVAFHHKQLSRIAQDPLGGHPVRAMGQYDLFPV